MPANHELFESQSVAELTYEMFEDLLLQKQEILDQLEDVGSKQANELYKQLNSINVALGEKELVQDELIDRWEQELAAGITPNLEE